MDNVFLLSVAVFCDHLRTLSIYDIFLSNNYFDDIFLKQTNFSRIIPSAVESQLIHIIGEIMEDRRKNNIVKNDFLDSISKLCKHSQFSEEIDFIAQIAAFFLDAYETSSWVGKILFSYSLVLKYNNNGTIH